MNYFTHAVPFLGSDLYVVGTSIPDMLAVVDRRARLRLKAVDRRIGVVQQSPSDVAEHELLSGIRQHLLDDRWFHGTEGFYSVTAKLGEEFRSVLPEADSWRCGFLGHLVMELLLDDVLIELDRSRLEAFYESFQRVDHSYVQAIVSSVATREVPDLARFLGLFLNERFLDDYANDERLRFRLNQVMKRVKLDPLPESVFPVLEFGRGLVKENVAALLPLEMFPNRDVLGDLS
ncbi:hypothetical protein KOR42_18400 [Thalassoglobus neptunius]|uniref:Uncharacterized protein n=1 Tax=Thalassoglobus neptunius TaxID=1938619 RepID=A0A5C5X8I7_9PLAN|nr:hypothetical protein [Thalassoglobus neptunius]TWT58465.1 hypothetical protein KOR42_18400 [Thalassoglobus neptunius]